MKKNEVKFYHPEINTDDLDLLIANIKSKVPFKECVQISLDNCTIQRMESLTENSTLDDVDKVGLYPLYRILNECPNVLLASLGTIEMPGSKVSYANYSYELFCKKFWENSRNTPDAIYRDFDELEKKVEFSNLVENSQQVIGLFYLPFLLIQNILKKYITAIETIIIIPRFVFLKVKYATIAIPIRTLIMSKFVLPVEVKISGNTNTVSTV